MNNLERIRHHVARASSGDDASREWLSDTLDALRPEASIVERGWLIIGRVYSSDSSIRYIGEDLVARIFELDLLLDYDDDPILWTHTRNYIATFHIETGDWYAALLTILTTLRHIDSADFDRVDVSQTLSTLGWLLVQLGQPAQAIPYIERALSFATGINRFTDTYSDLIEALLNQGKIEEADQAFAALGALTLPPTERSLAKTCLPHARLASHHGRHEEVLAFTRREGWALKLLSDETAVMHALSANSALALGRIDDALEHAELGQAVISHQPSGQTYSTLMTTRARALAALGRTDDMLALLLDYDAHQQERNTRELGAQIVGLITQMEHEVHNLRHVELESSNQAYERVNARLKDEIEARREAEEHVRHTIALHAVGELAAGFAHDLNNLLVVIYSCVGMLEEEVHADQLPLVRDIGTTADRASGLVRRLMALSNQPDQQPSRLDLSALIASMRPLLTHAIREEVALTLQCEEGVLVEANPAELEQIVLNLTINAQDAIDGLGSIVIRVDTHEGSARLRVSDSGSGMTPEVAARVFDPFFSTKHDSHGTGLGLAITARLIKRMGATIDLESTPNEGTTFTITMPMDAPRQDPRSTPKTPEPQDEPDLLAILVVEDDDAVRNSVVRLLTLSGHVTLQACDGVEGLEVFEANAGRIDVVISDVVMPRASGVDLAQRLLSAYDTPIIFMTGYTEDDRLKDLLEDERVQLLAKPFDLRLLRRAIAHAVESTTRTP